MNDYVKAVLVAAGLFLAWEFSSIILLLFASVLLAVGLEAIASSISRLGIPQKWSFALMFPALIIMISLVALVASPTISAQYEDFAQRFPAQAQSAVASVNEMFGIDIPADVEGLRSYVEPSSFLQATRTLGESFGILADVFFVLIIAIYLAASPKDYSNFLGRFSEKRKEQVEKVTKDLKWWLAGRLMSMGAIFLLTTIGLYVLGVPFALILGLLAGLLSFIPNLGPILALLPALIVSFVQSPLMAVYVLILYGGVQILEGYLITPQIDRRTVSMPPALQLASQLVFGSLFGFIGLVLAVPLAVTMRSFLD